MVTKIKMMETEMDYRGTKSEFQFIEQESIKTTVKAQRVDSSYGVVNIKPLRCTLLDFKRKSTARILSNQIIKKTYYTLTHPYELLKKIGINP